MSDLTLQYIAKHIGAALQLSGGGADDVIVEGVGTLANANHHQISFLMNPKYSYQLADTQALAVVIEAKQVHKAPEHLTLLVCNNPQFAMAKLAALFDPAPCLQGVAPSASVAATAKLAADVVVGEGCVIEDHVEVGAGTMLKSHVTLCHHVKIGRDCIIHPGAVIGSDGFGNAWDHVSGCWHKVPQIGSVTIGNDVEIGSNTTIDRGTLEDTRIGNNVRIDNLVQIAHNVEIGDHTAIAAQTGIAGSTRIGKNCLIGGQAGISGHVDICDGVTLTASTTVSHSIREPGIYSSGMTARPNQQWRRNIARFNQLGKK